MSFVRPKRDDWFSVTEQRFRVMYDMQRAGSLAPRLDRIPGGCGVDAERLVACAADAKRELGQIAAFAGALDYALLCMVAGMGLDYKETASRWYQVARPTDSQRRHVAKRYREAIGALAIHFGYATERNFDAVPGFDGRPDD